MNAIRLCLFPVFLVALVSCGETKQEVIERYQGRFDKLREELKLIAKEVPMLPVKLDAELPLDPKPSFEEGAPGSNTAILMYEQLTNPQVDFRVINQLDLLLGNGFDSHVAWTCEESSMSEDALDDAAGKLEGELKHSLGIRYIGVIRVLRYVEPTVEVDEGFSGGRADFGVHLWDRQEKKMICSFSTQASSDDKFSFAHRSGDNPALAMKEFADSTLLKNSRQVVLETLAAKTGGTFEER